MGENRCGCDGHQSLQCPSALLYLGRIQPGTWWGHFYCLCGSHTAMRPVNLQWDLITLLTSGYDLILKTEVSLCVPSWQVGVATTDWKWNCQPSSRLTGARGKLQSAWSDGLWFRPSLIPQMQNVGLQVIQRGTKRKFYGWYSNNGLKNYYWSQSKDGFVGY